MSIFCQQRMNNRKNVGLKQYLSQQSMVIYYGKLISVELVSYVYATSVYRYLIRISKHQIENENHKILQYS